MGSHRGSAAGDVPDAVSVLRTPPELLHPDLAVRVHELRSVPAGLVYEPGVCSALAMSAEIAVFAILVILVVTGRYTPHPLREPLNSSAMFPGLSA